MILNVLKENPGFTWLDISNPSQEELKDIADRFKLHNTSLEDCLDYRQQPKFERIDHVMFFIFRAYDPCCNPQTDNIWQLTRKIAFFLGENFVITIHREDLDLMKEIRQKWQEQNVTNQDGYNILIDIIKGILFSYTPALEQLEESIEEFEKILFSDEDTPTIIREIHWFRSRVSAIRRIFRQTYDAVLKLEDYPIDNAPVIHDIHERLERYLTLTEALRENSNDILNTHISLASHRTNEVIRILTIFSVFFLPLTFVVGVYGMNFVHMPELRWYYGYPVTWLLMISTTLAIYLWFKRRGWLR